MKKIYKSLFILAVLFVSVNVALAENLAAAENNPDLNNLLFLPEETQQNTVEPQLTEQGLPEPDIVVNEKLIELSRAEVWAGKKFKDIDNFVFQIDSKMLDTLATLRIKEIILAPGSKMAPPQGMQLGSNIYEFDFKPQADVKMDKALWFSIKYGSIDYFRKNIYYFDQNKNQWVGIEGKINHGSKKITVNFSLPYAKVAILEGIDIMTEGVASWYKYKNCDCAASPDYPKGTKLKVTNLKNNKSVVVKVNDWGPDRSVHPNRVIDLDIVAFKKIASKSQGLCQVKVEVVGAEKVAINQK